MLHFTWQRLKLILIVFLLLSCFHFVILNDKYEFRMLPTYKGCNVDKTINKVVKFTYTCLPGVVSTWQSERRIQHSIRVRNGDPAVNRLQRRTSRGRDLVISSAPPSKRTSRAARSAKRARARAINSLFSSALLSPERAEAARIIRLDVSLRWTHSENGLRSCLPARSSSRGTEPRSLNFWNPVLVASS